MHGLGQHRRADDVDVQRLEPVRAARCEAVVEIRAREVDKEVDAAEALGGRSDERADLVVVANVGCREEDRLPELPLQSGAALGVDVGDGDVRSGLAEGANDTRADQRRAAGDHRRLAVQPAHPTSFAARLRESSGAGRRRCAASLARVHLAVRARDQLLQPGVRGGGDSADRGAQLG